MGVGVRPPMESGRNPGSAAQRIHVIRSLYGLHDGWLSVVVMVIELRPQIQGPMLRSTTTVATE